MTHSILPPNAKPFHNVFLVEVTPELARAWLDRGNFNRPPSQTTIARYVRQIKAGLWKRTHQGLAFTQAEILIDGQHRLHAIIQTGMTLPMLVFINEPTENFEFIDCGRNRSNLDMLRLGMRDATITSKHIQTLRSFLAGRFCMTTRWTNAELNRIFPQYAGAIAFVVDLFSGYKDRSVDDPTVRGVVAKAHYHAPEERLAEFVKHLAHHDRDPSLDRLRKCLWEWTDRRENTRREIFTMTQKGLLIFLHGEENAQTFTPSKDWFPIPAPNMDVTVDSKTSLL